MPKNRKKKFFIKTAQSAKIIRGVTAHFTLADLANHAKNEKHRKLHLRFSVGKAECVRVFNAVVAK